MKRWNNGVWEECEETKPDLTCEQVEEVKGQMPTREIPFVYQPKLGMWLTEAIGEMVALALRRKQRISALFNGVPLVVTTEDPPSAILKRYNRAAFGKEDVGVEQ